MNQLQSKPRRCNQRDLVIMKPIKSTHTSQPLLHLKILAITSFLLATTSGLAQQAQDNWYLAQTRSYAGMAATNGGLSSPYGVTIGPDGRIYVGDQGYGCIQVYLASGCLQFLYHQRFRRRSAIWPAARDDKRQTGKPLCGRRRQQLRL